MAGRKRGEKADRRADKTGALDKGLKAMFRTLEQRPTPDSIKAVVDQLDASDDPAPAKGKR